MSGRNGLDGGSRKLTSAQILFLAAVVLPIFFSKINATPLWLVAQAGALAWSIGQHSEFSAHTLLAVTEILLVRAMVAPWLLSRAIANHEDAGKDLIPSNLFAWAIGITLLVLAFQFATSGLANSQTLTIGVVGSTVVMALLVLSTNESQGAQLAAVLFMENALTLFESLSPQPWPLPIHVALVAVYVLTVAIGARLIGTPDPLPAGADWEHRENRV